MGQRHGKRERERESARPSPWVNISLNNFNLTTKANGKQIQSHHFVHKITMTNRENVCITWLPSEKYSNINSFVYLATIF